MTVLSTLTRDIITSWNGFPSLPLRPVINSSNGVHPRFVNGMAPSSELSVEKKIVKRSDEGSRTYVVGNGADGRHDAGTQVGNVKSTQKINHTTNQVNSLRFF